jgi:hypothetical protein
MQPDHNYSHLSLFTPKRDFEHSIQLSVLPIELSMLSPVRIVEGNRSFSSHRLKGNRRPLIIFIIFALMAAGSGDVGADKTSGGVLLGTAQRMADHSARHERHRRRSTGRIGRGVGHSVVTSTVRGRTALMHSTVCVSIQSRSTVQTTANRKGTTTVAIRVRGKIRTARERVGADLRTRDVVPHRLRVHSHVVVPTGGRHKGRIVAADGGGSLVRKMRFSREFVAVRGR